MLYRSSIPYYVKGEALATAGNWTEALKEFASLQDKVGQTAKKEQDGSAKSADLGEFWWTYAPTYENAEDTFKIHAGAPKGRGQRIIVRAGARIMI